MRNTRVKLDERSMYRHGLGTLETERSNVNHIVDMINVGARNHGSIAQTVHRHGSKFIAPRSGQSTRNQDLKRTNVQIKRTKTKPEK